MLINEDLDEDIAVFYRKIYDWIHLHVSNIKKRKKSSSYFSNETTVKKKNKFHKKWKKYNDLNDYVNFKRIRCRIRKLIALLDISLLMNLI